MAFLYVIDLCFMFSSFLFGFHDQANYALKYKSGVAAPRMRGPKRMSEYAMQFTWKKGMAASPLLAAEQVSPNYAAIP